MPAFTMNGCNIPIDKSICDEVGESLYEILMHYKIKSVLDVSAFVKKNGYEPCISSIFLYGGGGSYCFENDDGETVHIHNGTLAAVRKGDDFITFSDESDEYTEILRKRLNKE